MHGIELLNANERLLGDHEQLLGDHERLLGDQGRLLVETAGCEGGGGPGELVILLYASELFLHEVKWRWNSLSLGTVAALAVLAYGGWGVGGSPTPLRAGCLRNDD